MFDSCGVSCWCDKSLLSWRHDCDLQMYCQIGHNIFDSAFLQTHSYTPFWATLYAMTSKSNCVRGWQFHAYIFVINTSNVGVRIWIYQDAALGSPVVAMSTASLLCCCFASSSRALSFAHSTARWWGVEELLSPSSLSSSLRFSGGSGWLFVANSSQQVRGAAWSLLHVRCDSGVTVVKDRERRPLTELDFTTVMKFGWSSVASAQRMWEVAQLILSFPEERPVIVLSAPQPQAASQ